MKFNLQQLLDIANTRTQASRPSFDNLFTALQREFYRHPPREPDQPPVRERRAQAAAAHAQVDASQSSGVAGLFGRGTGNASIDAWTAMKLRIHKTLVEQMDLKKTNTDSKDPKQPNSPSTDTPRLCAAFTTSSVTRTL